MSNLREVCPLEHTHMRGRRIDPH